MILRELPPEALSAILGAMQSVEETKHPIAPDIAAVALREARRHWNAPNEFKPDDLVKVSRTNNLWKTKLGLGLVLRTYDEVDEATQTSGLRYMHNMRILILHNDGSTQELAVHSRDFEHASV